MKPLIVANWKCNPTTLKEAKRLFNLVKKGIKNIKNIEVVICPPFTYLSSIKYQVSSIKLGSQDVFYEEKGAYTGEVSPRMLKNLGCQYVILGHSERRIHLGETDEMINKKVKATLKKGLKVILCVGDKSRKSKEDIKEVAFQLKKDLKGIKKSDFKNLIITYEPIWAISTMAGRVATPKDAKEGAEFIQKTLIKSFGFKTAKKIRILYGGSITSKNARDFIYKGKMDGLLIGQASLDPKEFIKIVKSLSS